MLLPSRRKKTGYWLDLADRVSDAFTYFILSEDNQIALARNVARHDSGRSNKLAPHGDDREAAELDANVADVTKASSATLAELLRQDAIARNADRELQRALSATPIFSDTQPAHNDGPAPPASFKTPPGVISDDTSSLPDRRLPAGPQNAPSSAYLLPDDHSDASSTCTDDV